MTEAPKTVWLVEWKATKGRTSSQAYIRLLDAAWRAAEKGGTITALQAVPRFSEAQVRADFAVRKNAEWMQKKAAQ